jgi:ABC-2 type transport system ATP-binding protein
MSVVDFQDIHRAYRRGKDVLKGITFAIEPGQVVGLVGKNGAGKTTLIHIAMGMIEPQMGAVRIFGLDPRDKPLDVKKRVGYVSEDQILPPFLTIGEVIDLHRGLFDKWDNRMEKELRERFELSRSTKIKDPAKVRLARWLFFVLLLIAQSSYCSMSRREDSTRQRDASSWKLLSNT